MVQKQLYVVAIFIQFIYDALYIYYKAIEAKVADIHSYALFQYYL